MQEEKRHDSACRYGFDNGPAQENIFKKYFVSRVIKLGKTLRDILVYDSQGQYYCCSGRVTGVMDKEQICEADSMTLRELCRSDMVGQACVTNYLLIEPSQQPWKTLNKKQEYSQIGL